MLGKVTKKLENSLLLESEMKKKCDLMLILLIAILT